MPKKFFYQPDFSTTVICWSYTFIILLLGFILWLEITFFQVWTLLALVVFTIAAALQLGLRRVEVKQHELILHTVIPQNTKKLQLEDIKKVSKKKGRLVVQTKYHSHSLFMRTKSKQIIYDFLKKAS
ncbi:EbsA family protein [Liquorilactobacillus capillatus]|uniref:Pore-forming protein n=1 Tax=Liquorilactobacillus capillatus DSM 19910 TaxID=1423731 RepID=A0A0R1M1I1_9LACO|nr:EbsA family protein [Liquorilactobacillus capillatus]KRL01537.1 hypothetical protein FC81_GL001221 [Liquorilactobacillus capillatus DSM 19910]